MDRKRNEKKLIKKNQTNANKRIHLISLRWKKIFGTLLQSRVKQRTKRKRQTKHYGNNIELQNKRWEVNKIQNRTGQA